MSRPLFGGAIVCPIRPSFLDASSIRQVPDNQEVFVDTETQQSFIVELLEPADARDQEIAKFHFQQLCEDNEAADSVIVSVEHCKPEEITPLLPKDTTEVYLLHGKQMVAKFNEKDALNTIDILLAVVRFNQVSTDCVISMNVPVQVAANSSEAESFTQANVDLVKQDMMTILQGLQVKDWSLFG
ncbi:Mog1p/PsbP-like protein [Rhizopus microsporus var. microsporus]|uniref:Mog1p/PsbP-like protein n=2 Tax=Rhizopus microsporus TaxID=58291 RepID=A0A2G4T557_RHIZD|nr:Mog1p/PsbP-like protein [Rhizopus microsporus ATCC 52813]ORE02390.1 Mog1p/PsbP-like protein [Rhizopus microsporus var. microsporus]PHZ15806.1 Mog1p/PsbP-like protein [Rhizopus microsporus ATCC 52813]